MNEATIKAIATAAAAEVLKTLGLTPGEMSRNQAIKTYGVWFKTAEASGRIKPVRSGPGKTSTKWYAVSDILAMRAADMSTAKI